MGGEHGHASEVLCQAVGCRAEHILDRCSAPDVLEELPEARDKPLAVRAACNRQLLSQQRGFALGLVTRVSQNPGEARELRLELGPRIGCLGAKTGRFRFSRLAGGALAVAGSGRFDQGGVGGRACRVVPPGRLTQARGRLLQQLVLPLQFGVLRLHGGKLTGEASRPFPFRLQGPEGARGRLALGGPGFELERERIVRGSQFLGTYAVRIAGCGEVGDLCCEGLEVFRLPRRSIGPRARRAGGRGQPERAWRQRPQCNRQAVHAVPMVHTVAMCALARV